jgi:hypothetical protein
MMSLFNQSATCKVLQIWIIAILLMKGCADVSSDRVDAQASSPNACAKNFTSRLSLDPAFDDSDLSRLSDAYPDGISDNMLESHKTASRGYANRPPTGWRSITMWGEVFAAKGWKPAQAPNTRVQIRAAETWILAKSTGKWKQVQCLDRVVGRAYAVDYKNDANKPAQLRDESNNGGGISVVAGNGYNFHFWAGRVGIDPSDIAGVYTKFEARLILNNPKALDDRASARYIAGSGADYWRNQTAQWASDWSNNGEVGGGRLKWVKKDWQVFAMTTLSTKQMRQNPPPLTFR